MYEILRMALIISLIVFVPYKLAGWYGVKRRRYYVIGFVTFTMGCMVLMILASKYGGSALDFFYKVSMYWVGYLAFLLMFTFIYFVIGRLLPLSSRSAVVGILFLSLVVAGYATVNAKHYKNYEIELAIEGVTEPVVIYHAPDVHLGAFAGVERSMKVVADINEIQPDVVIFNGDFFDSKVALTHENLAPFKETTVPMYFTVGNHDVYVGMDEIRALFNEYGIIVLENEVIDIKGVQILGLDYINPDEHTVDSHSSAKTETMKSVLPTIKLNKDEPIVIAAHKPVGIPYMVDAGADLILNGHTHGGQIFPATLLASIQFEYLKGLYNYNDTLVYVTKGIGTFGPPMRFGADAEATIIKLVPEK